jgi:endonuclease-3
LGLSGLCKAAERSKVNLGRKLKEESIKKDEDGNLVEKTETIKQAVVARDVPINAEPGSELLVESVTDLPLDEGLTKEEERVTMDEIANTPGTITKKRK